MLKIMPDEFFRIPFDALLKEHMEETITNEIFVIDENHKNQKEHFFKKFRVKTLTEKYVKCFLTSKVVSCASVCYH